MTDSFPNPTHDGGFDDHLPEPTRPDRTDQRKAV